MFFSQEQFFAYINQADFSLGDSNMVTKWDSSDLLDLQFTLQPNTNLECFIQGNSSLNYSFDLLQNSKLKIILITQNVNLDFDCKLQINLQKLNASVELFLLNQASGYKLKLDLVINHLSASTFSTTLVKSINARDSKLDAHGTVFIPKNSKDCQASMKFKGLLLDANSQIKFEPNLKILENQVVCNHGATISNLDQNYRNYLYCRGISLESAKNLLLESFTTEITREIPLICL